MDLGEFFPNFEKNRNLQKKKIVFEDWDFHSVTTHTGKPHDDYLLPLHLISTSI